MARYYDVRRALPRSPAGFALVFGVAAVAIGGVLAGHWIATPVAVRVANRMGEPVTDVAVSTVDEEKSLGQIAPGGEATAVLRPGRESGVGVRFRGARGTVCGGSVDVYVERGIRGTIDVLIVECHKLEIRQHVSPSFF